MGRFSTVEAREQLSTIINRAAFGKERIVLTRRGQELVAVVPIEDLELLRKLEDLIDVEDARAALEEARHKGTISLAELKAELGI